MSSAIQQLAAQLNRLERNVRSMSTTPALAYSSIEDGGSIDSNADDGKTMAQYGGQFDGSFMAASLVGPTPPICSAPIVTAAIGGLTVRWDGLFADADFAPMDFTRVEFQVSTVAGFDALSAATLAATVETPRGATLFIPRAPGVYYVAFVARSQSGKAGPKSVTVGPTTVALIANTSLASPVKPQEVFFYGTHALTPTYQTMMSTTVTVPAGFTSAIVTVTAFLGGYNSATTGGTDGRGGDYFYSTLTLNGASIGAQETGFAPGGGGWGVSPSAASEVLSGLTPGGTFSLGVKAWTDSFTDSAATASASGVILWLR